MNSHPPFPQDDFIASDEVDTLLSTLREYSDALRTRLDVLDASKIWFSIMFAVSASLIPIVLMTSPSGGIIDLIKAGGQEGALSLLSFALGATSAILMIAFLVGRLRRSLKDVHRMANNLSVLVRRASQLRDRSNFSFAQRVYVDVALNDAESLLGQATRELRNSLLFSISYLRRSDFKLNSTRPSDS